MFSKHVSVYFLSSLCCMLTSRFGVADRPSSESSSAAIELDGAANTQVTGDFADQPVLMSQMEDFDLFNTLDWNFDDNLASSWS
jgi:hypothetical protein